jgi:F420-dependent oxidoreductase-like protein
MQVCIFASPLRGATYDDFARAARRAEDGGFDGFFRSDHYRSIGATDLPPGPTDAWITLAGLARETSRIRLGTLVTAATFRPPGVLAITAAQVDQMSGGRVELGMGTGWYPPEHTGYGLEFPSARVRFERLAEQLEVITGLWQTPPGQLFTYRGTHYQVVESPALPKPVQAPRPPIIIGGTGPRRTPALAVRYADEFNISFRNLEETAQQFKLVTETAARLGREAPLAMSAGVSVVCGRSDEEVRRRAERLGQRLARSGADVVAGSPARIVDYLGGFAGLGTRRVYLRITDLADLDHLDVLAAEVLPQMR